VSFVARLPAHAYVKITTRMTVLGRNALLRPSGLAEPVRVGDPWSSGLCDRLFGDYLVSCMTVSAEKGGEKRRKSDTSVDSDAKFAREQYIRVAAMDIMVIEGIWNICVVAERR
jgi:hypothetical protein